MRSNVNDLFRSYLTGRKQRVKFKNTYSKYVEVSFGVPQGMLLGPILFLIFINDFYEIVTKAKIIEYADDTAIIFTDYTWENLKSNISDTFTVIMKWFYENRLLVNVDKTLVMLVVVMHQVSLIIQRYFLLIL